MTPERDGARLRFSCLSVTEDRPEFAAWLLWNYLKQDHRERELVIVDSSAGPSPWPDRPDVRVVTCPPGTSVPAKRNLALRHASGQVVTWFDDDDWQHPRKLSLLAAGLAGAQLAGTSRGWFLELASGRARRHGGGRRVPVFNSIAVPTAVATGVLFDAERRRASDTPWLAEVRRRTGWRFTDLPEPLFFWLCHARNLSNPAGAGRPFPHRLDAIRAAVGADDWGDTDEQIARLRAIVAPPAPSSAPAPRPHVPVSAPGTEAPARRRGCIVITTFDRPDELGRLLDDIEAQWPGDDWSVMVFDDAGTVGSAAAETRIRRRGWTYVRAARNHGKRRWWEWWNTILAVLRQTSAHRFVVLQDDMRLCESFFERAEEAWSRIRDPRKASLFLHLDDYGLELGRARWTPFTERRVDGLVECGWVDLGAFVCERRLFDALEWRLRPIVGRWTRDPLLGSGVGAQISTRLFAQDLTMYRVEQSLTVHVHTRSRMNPEARRRWPVRSRRFVDGDAAARELAGAAPEVFASLASVPARERHLGEVVERLVPQVNRLGVYLNGYTRVPRFLSDDRIQVEESRSHGDRGDAGKFFWAADAHPGYVLTCDDDIAYPADYVERLVDGIERHGRTAVVGFHGAILREPLADYYRSRRLLHFSQALPRDTGVHVLGTGVSGYHSSTVQLRPADFPQPDMADIYLGLAGQEQRVPFVCLRHDAGWLRELPGTRPGSIYERARSAGNQDPSPATTVARRDGGWRVHAVVAPPEAAPTRGSPRGTKGPPPEGQGDLSTRAPTALGPLVEVDVRGPRDRACLLLPKDDHITVAVQRSGTYYEADLLQHIRQLGLAGTYVDVGAHYGNHTVYFAVECEAAHVVAVEPNPESMRGLVAAVERNGVTDRVTALPLAIHPSGNRVDLCPLPWKPGRRNAARTNSGMVAVEPARGHGQIPSRRLDDALAPFERIALVKIDVEGLGVEVLGSGRGTLERDRPAVAIEAAPGPECERVRELLAPLGYELIGQHCWTPTWLWAPR